MENDATRPQAGRSKISSRNEFELCYIRHRYFRRSNYNPTPEEMAPYLPIIKNLAWKTLSVHSGLFYMIGFEREDLVNIGMIHLVSFLGLFSMEMLPDKYKEFVEKFILEHNDPPEEDDVVDKNRANFTIFLKQRFKEVVRICRQKARNVTGTALEVFQPLYGPNKPPMNLEILVDKYDLFNFRKMDLDVFKTIRKKAKAYGKLAFRHEKTWYILVPVRQKILEAKDFSGADLDPRDNIHNMNPEKLLSHLEENDKWDRKKRIFKRKSIEEKQRILQRFIRKNKNVPMFAEEVKTARRTLNRMGPWKKKNSLRSAK